MQNKKRGFIAILAAFIIPICTLIFYLNIQATKNSYTRIAFEDALKQAALEAARKYISGVSVANQQTYLDRIAAVSFNNAIKAKIGITSNLVPLTRSVVKYGRAASSYFDTTQTEDGENGYVAGVLNRYQTLSNSSYWESTNIDPDADKTVDVMPNGDKGYLLCRGSSGSYEPRQIMYKSKNTNSNTITVKKSTKSDAITVEANVIIDKRKYKKSYTVTAPKLNADIVLGLPLNTASMTANNDPYGVIAWNSNYKETPLWQMKTECRDFVKKLLGYRNCSIGLIPYAGNVSLPYTDYKKITVSHGEYKYNNYAAVNPTIPIAEAYKFAGGESGIGKDLNNAPKLPTAITAIMYRSDLETYLQKYMNNGTKNASAIENLIYGEVTSSTKFMRATLDIMYGHNANILAGYSRFNWHNYPNPYPVYGLTEKPLELYRYLALIAPYHCTNKMSSFLYLPVMLGMSMLKNGWQKKTSYTNGDKRKKILILFVNQADLWQPREVTYFGLSNDASYISMVDGDRIDYEKGGNLESVSGGYYRNKIYRSANGYTPGTFLTAYDEAVAMKCNYIKDSTRGTYYFKLPKPGNVKIVLRTDPCMIIYKTNPHSPSVKVTAVKAVHSGSVLEKDDHFQCYAPRTGTKFTVTCSGLRESPVVAKTQMNGLEYDSTPDRMALRQDENYVYICVSNSSDTTENYEINISVSPISGSSQMKQYDAISYVDKQLIGYNTEIADITKKDHLDFSQKEHTINVLYNVKLNIEHSYSLRGDYKIRKDRDEEKETQNHLHYFIGSDFSESSSYRLVGPAVAESSPYPLYEIPTYERIYISQRNIKLRWKVVSRRKRCNDSVCKDDSQCSCNCGESAPGNSENNFEIQYGSIYRGGWTDATKDKDNHDDIEDKCKIDSHQWSDYGYKHITYIYARLKAKTFTDNVEFSNRNKNITISPGHYCNSDFSNCIYVLVVGSKTQVNKKLEEICGSLFYFCVNSLKVKGNILNEKKRSYISPPKLSLSGNYSNNYTLHYGYSVIYIPRDKISANPSDNDSATISLTLDETKIISIEWSNHLNGTEGCHACSDSSGNDAKLSGGSKAVYYEPFKRSKNARWNSVSGTYNKGDIPFSGHGTIKLSTEENALANDPKDPDDRHYFLDKWDKWYYFLGNRYYLNNPQTMSSYQYIELKKSISSFDYPRSDGTFTFIMENIKRMPELYAWTSNTSGTHSTEFNYMNCIGRYSDIFRTSSSYDPKTGGENIRFCVNAPEKGCIARLGLVECTIDVNRVLMAAGYQKCEATDNNSNLMDNGPTWCMRTQITPKVITAFKNKFGNNGRIYVIHYRYNNGGFSGWSPSNWGVYKNYTASNQAELKKVLAQIMKDIEKFAEFENAKIIEAD